MGRAGAVQPQSGERLKSHQACGLSGNNGLRPFRSGGRDLLNGGAVTASVLSRCANCGGRRGDGRSGILRGSVMMTGRRRLRRRIAGYCAHGPREREQGKDHQQGRADRPQVQAHVTSIPRLGYRPLLQVTYLGHRFARRNRRAFPITETELNVIAALAIIGLSSNPNTGYNTPAATGTPSTL